MANSIRGLTVEIAADAGKFNQAMKDVRSEARNSQNELTALQKSLKLDFNNETLVKAQQAAQKAIDATTEKAELQRARLAELEKAGKVDTSGYSKLQTELIKTENELKTLQGKLTELQNMKFTQLAGQFENVGKSITNVAKNLTPLSVAAGGALGAFAALGKKAISTADNVATLATQYGMTAEELERMNYIALQTDTASDDMYKGLVKVRAGLADLATGTVSTTATALQKLNLDLSQFGSSDEQFYGIIAALSSMEDETQRVAMANDIFGDKLANSLIPIINAGGGAISEYADEFKEVGALSNEQVAALANFDNVLNKLKTQFANVALQIGSSFLPIMEKIADIVSNNIVPKLQQLSNWFNNLSLSQQEFAVKALLVVAALAPVTAVIGKIVGSVGSLIKLIPTLSTLLTGLAAHPIIAIIGVVAALLTILYTANEQFRESINSLISTLMAGLSPVLGAISNILQTIINLFMPLINLVGNLLAQIMPLINVALLPLRFHLEMLAIPLTMLGEMLNWLAPIFTAFAGVIQKTFSFVIKIVNWVLKGIETAINAGIAIINGLIDAYNNTAGWLFGKVGRIGNVSLQVKMPNENDVPSASGVNTGNNPSNNYTSGNYPWDSVNSDGIAAGDNYEYNYDNSSKTQNVTVVIENYAKEVDVDDLVQKINVKLAEAL